MAKLKVSTQTETPIWLPAFPFIEQQWQSVIALNARYPQLSDYRLEADWHDHTRQNSSLDLADRLRLFRQSRIAYMAVQDFTQPVFEHIDVLQAVSALADWLIKIAYEAAVEDVRKRYGEVRDELGNRVILLVFALGKLGAAELNYSSDVDLVFIYEQGGHSNGAKSIDANQYFNRIGKKLIQLLDQYTTKGRVYQVDMRLRPFGSVGPLTCSLDSLQQYLLNEGREWERFAWMRARLIAGDEAAGERVIQSIKPFIYRRHLDYSVFESLAKIKAEMNLLTDYESDDLKYGLGGIRSVEFIVQSLQMTFGGRDESLQGVAIFQQLQNLYQSRKLSNNDTEVLTNGWLWLRKSENILQISEDMPAHEFKVKSILQTPISHFMGQSSWQEYCHQLQIYRRQINEIFQHLFDDLMNHETPLTVAQHREINQYMAELPLQRLPKSTTEKVQKLLEQVMLMHGDSKTILKVRPVVSSARSNLQEPVPPTTIPWSRLLRVVKAILKRPSYLSMLIKEQPLLAELLRLFDRHAYVADTIAQYPVLLELLFDSHPVPTKLSQTWLESNWQQQLKGNRGDVEQWMESARYFKLSCQFLIICDWLDGHTGNRQCCLQLSRLAFFILQKVISFSHEETMQKLEADENTSVAGEDLMVIGYGSLASGQMKLSSDMDLVFVIDRAQLNNEQRNFMQRWVKRITHHLNVRLYHGYLYDIDLQLRPDGNSGSLVTSRVEFENYQRNRAWIWEHAALIKSKLVYGTTQQRQLFKQLRAEILQQPRVTNEVNEALATMREKLLKTDSQHQLEFEVMAAVLIHGAEYPQLASLQHLAEMFKQLKQLGLMADNKRLPKPPIPVN